MGWKIPQCEWTASSAQAPFPPCAPPRGTPASPCGRTESPAKILEVVGSITNRRASIRPLALAAILAISSACATVGKTVPATSQSITSGLALGDIPESAGDAWVDNRSSVAITVVSITLHFCSNIKQACDVRIPIDARVEPDTRSIVYHVLRQTPFEAYRVTFATEWHADSTAKP